MSNKQVSVDMADDQKNQQRNSDITRGSENQFQEQIQNIFDVILENSQTQFNRVRIFSLNQCSTHKNLSFKVNKSAVSWIQTNCWLKGFDLETTLLSIIFYYAYCAKNIVNKTKLQLILTACIFVAKKYTSGPSMAIDNALEMVSGKFSKEHLMETESEIFQIIDYDCHFQHTVHLLQEKKLTQEEQYKIKFLTEILLLKDVEILCNKSYFELLINIVRDMPNAQIPSDIPQLLISKQCQILLNKYKSYFQADEFMSNIIEYALGNNETKQRHST